MEIRFISSLTADDENQFAPAVLKALTAVLDQLPIAYTMRIQTSGSQVFQHTHAAMEEPAQGGMTRGTSLAGAAAALYASSGSDGN